MYTTCSADGRCEDVFFFFCLSGGKSESQRQQLPAEGWFLQACAEGLAGLQRGGEAADRQAAGQVGQRNKLHQADMLDMLKVES